MSYVTPVARIPDYGSNQYDLKRPTQISYEPPFKKRETDSQQRQTSSFDSLLGKLIDVEA